MKPELGGKTAIFDLDMTLVEYTFAPAIFSFADSLANITGEEIDGKEFRKEWQRIFEDFRPLFVVNPIISTITAQILMERYGVDNRSKVGRELLYKVTKAIYNTPTEEMCLCLGAMEAVAAAKDNCSNIMIGTIGKSGWTKRVKMARTGLSEHFDDQNIHCFNVNLPKSDQWGELIENYDLNISEVFVVGDDLYADILPMIELGVSVAFWVNNGKMVDEAFEQTEVPEGVIKLKTTGELVGYF